MNKKGNFLIINKKCYYILDEYKSLDISKCDAYILSENDDIYFKYEHSTDIHSLEDIKDYHSYVDKDDIFGINYFKDLLSLMISYKRDIAIDKVLCKYNYYEQLSFAC